MRIQDGPFHPRILAPSEALRHKHQHLQALTSLAHQFGGRVVDISTDNCIVELYPHPFPNYPSLQVVLVLSNSFYLILYLKDASLTDSSAKPSRIDAFMKLLYPFGILESSRSGMMALPRTPMDTIRADSETEKDVEDIVDVTALPPG